MFELIGLAVAVSSVVGAHAFTRHFVRTRLRYVDAILSRRASWVASGTTAIVAIPLCALLPIPFVGAVTGVLIAIGVGTGVRLGARDISGPSGYLRGP